MENDDRHYLYRHYLTIMKHLKPDFFVYENVPGLFSAQADGERIFAKLHQDFDALDSGYEIIPPLNKVKERPGSYILSSLDFGVPQRRNRLILIGYRRTLQRPGSRVQHLFGRLQQKAARHRMVAQRTVADAVSDLPCLEPGEGNDGFYGPYPDRPAIAHYQALMRLRSPGVLNHKARSQMTSDVERYKFFIERSANGGKPLTLKDLVDERPDLKPNHKNLDDFDDRFKVQRWGYPSSTITAHISKDGHYYIHPDIQQGRSFTVREAARCQSFPDNYKFEGPRTEQFRQVGNAVPPLLAGSIADLILRELTRIYETRSSRS